MNTTQIQSLSENLTNEQIEMPYPHLFIEEPSDAVGLVLPMIPKGNLSVVSTYKGQTRRIGSIEPTARNLINIYSVSAITFYNSKTDFTKIECLEDIMEVLYKWMPSLSSVQPS